MGASLKWIYIYKPVLNGMKQKIQQAALFRRGTETGHACFCCKMGLIHTCAYKRVVHIYQNKSCFFAGCRGLKRICFLEGDMTRSGGTERVTACVANALARQYEVHVASLCKSGKENFYYLNENIKDVTLFKEKSVDYKRKFFSCVKNIRRYCKKNKIDILIDVDIILDVFSVPALLGLPVSLVSWEHFNFTENLGVPLRDWGRKLAACFADVIVTLTKQDKLEYESRLHLKCPVVQIYNPVFNSMEKLKSSYDENSKIIFSAGHLIRRKGFDLMIESARIVLSKHPDWEWHICGEGEERPRLEQQIAEAGLQGKVKLQGRAGVMEDYYSHAAMFVLTSRAEGFGLVLTEAKAFHLPVVSFNCKCGPSEIILDGVNGYLIPCFDIQLMAQKICTLIEDTEIRRTFSENAMLDTEKFALDAIIRQWTTLLDNLGRRKK